MKLVGLEISLFLISGSRSISLESQTQDQRVKDSNEVFPPYKDDANMAGSVKNTDRNHRAQAIISIGKQLRVTERGESSFGEITANSPRAPGGEYRASGKLPPLLKSLLFGHSEGVASLVVHAAHHLLPAVV